MGLDSCWWFCSAMPDMVLGVDFPGGVNLMGDSNQDLQSKL